MDSYSESDKDLSRLRLKIKHLENDWRKILENWDDRGNINSIEDDLIALMG
ncbi:hypothetical protein PM032_17910 [Halorubrum ezzemoulense]|uniref:hypothetical protein n=1 Tax=Halorubrum ezzemoulense TaxID=337243 RepID=UPI00232EAC98|nr:hypothetical protein [Halorubrum ezzemoulense]MDB2272842.1 hypothetical protein [Halorubrum ezzemoulense]MDB9235719.1 hypothetical protein [Halorubrum ezzemoulense]